MPKSDKPNILVIWGDDIGISNLSCYSHGLMGYQTPNIDRIAQGRHDVHRFLRRTVLHGGALFLHHGPERLSHRPLQGRHPRRAGRDERAPRDHRGLPQEPGLRDRPVRQEPSRRSQPHAADQPRLRRVLRQSLSPQRRRRARIARLSQREGFPELPQDVRTARGDAFLGDRTRTIRPRSRAGAGSENRK